MDLYKIIPFPKKDLDVTNKINITMPSTQAENTTDLKTDLEGYFLLVWNTILTFALFTTIVVIFRMKKAWKKEVNYIKAKICDKISPTENEKHPGNHRFVLTIFTRGRSVIQGGLVVWVLKGPPNPCLHVKKVSFYYRYRKEIKVYSHYHLGIWQGHVKMQQKPLSKKFIWAISQWASAVPTLKFKDAWQF